MKRFSVLLLVIFLTGCSSLKDTTPSPDTLKIGSFNIEQFGETKASSPNTLTVLSKIATTFDVLTIQEVGSNNSSALESTNIAVMDAYVARINELAGSDSYAYVTNKQYAIIYRKATVQLVCNSLYSGTASFTYQPLTAYFRSIVGNFDFTMLVIHTSPLEAETEIPALKTAMVEVANKYNEPDVICLGDFNADGGYYTEGDGNDLDGFSGYITVIPNFTDTTVAPLSNTYDRIQLTKSLASNYTNTWGVVRFAENYNLSKCEGTATTTGTESALSDHFPVWAEFYVDRDED